MKSICFNTTEVRATLDGSKTQMRKVLKPQPKFNIPLGFCADEGKFGFGEYEEGGKIELYKQPYQIGDILYVREAFYKHNCAEKECIMKYHSDCRGCTHTKDGYCYSYKATHEYDINVKWLPSITMPKEAARIFLRIINVRVERLQDISIDDCIAEGIEEIHGMRSEIRNWYREYWDSTIKKKDLPLYGWEANPWVFVTEFERIEKPEELIQ